MPSDKYSAFKFRCIAMRTYDAIYFDSLTLIMCVMFITKITDWIRVFNFLWFSMWEAMTLIFCALAGFITLNLGLSFADRSLENGYSQDYNSGLKAFTRTLIRSIDKHKESED